MGKKYYIVSLVALVSACGSNVPPNDTSNETIKPAAVIEAKATPVEVATTAPTETPSPSAPEKPRSILGQWLSVDNACTKIVNHINIDKNGIGMIEGSCKAGKPISGDSYKGTMTCSENGDEWENRVFLRLKPNGNLLYSVDGGETAEYKRCQMEMDYGY